MKKNVFILFTLILFSISFQTMAHDFSAINNGYTIYYNITSSVSPYTVEVVNNNINSGQGELEIDVNGLAKGIYNIKVVSENVSATKKLVVK